ncbi:MAG TPA: SPFH domain-containing protein [Vicinamibacterales bacterium]|jgi:regulator of protease activity HflC (stomatin/prohibitin superfamily)
MTLDNSTIIREKQTAALSGGLVLAILLPLLVLLAGLIVVEARRGPDVVAWHIIAYALLAAAGGVCLGGLFVVNPNEAQVLQLFGRYIGTVKVPGLRWASPFYTKKRISQRVRNFESQRLKVNDIEGNPIEIAAVVVWRVVETAEASFEVDNYENFVHVQSEAALRNLATSYPYDAHDDKITSLRGQTVAVAEHLKTEIQDRLAKAGVEVIEARISHLAYAAEIAAAMLQRQQAGAIIAARQRIVEGAVGMVEMALERMSGKALLQLDEERRATMVSNLLIVLCGERAAQPVINAGTLYQ